MQIIRLPPRDVSYQYITQIRNIYSMKYLDHVVGVDHTDHPSEVCKILVWLHALP